MSNLRQETIIWQTNNRTKLSQGLDFRGQVQKVILGPIINALQTPVQALQFQNKQLEMIIILSSLLSRSRRCRFQRSWTLPLVKLANQEKHNSSTHSRVSPKTPPVTMPIKHHLLSQIRAISMWSYLSLCRAQWMMESGIACTSKIKRSQLKLFQVERVPEEVSKALKRWVKAKRVLVVLKWET